MTEPRKSDAKPHVDEVLETLPTERLEELLRALEEGRGAFEALVLAEHSATKPPPEAGSAEAVETVHHVAYGLLKLLSDDRRSRALWAALTGPPVPSGALTRRRLERSGVVLRLWRLFEGDEGRAYLRQLHRSVAFHRRRFFEWFLGRYELGPARGVLIGGGGGAVRQLHFGLLAGVLAVAGLHLTSPALAGPGGGGWRPWTLLLAVGVYLTVVLVQVVAFRPAGLTVTERWFLAGHSLVPRLAAASVVGLVILASSEELLGFVVRGASPWRAGVLLVASYAYLLLEMSRRVHPLPRPRRLLRLGADVGATALAHGLAIGVVAERALRSILDQPRTEVLSAVQLLNVAAFLLAIGLIVNLIWAEEPVTQPL